MSDNTINLSQEVEALGDCLRRGDPEASVHLARLIQADTRGALQPYAEALSARVCDHLNRYAELGITDPHTCLADEVYRLMRTAALDWDGLPKTGRPGEEA
jgi:hypothetical protein